MTDRERRTNALLRWVGLVLGAVFFAAGFTKLVGFPVHVQLFEDLGLPGWSLYLVGAIELELGVLVFLPRTRTWGAMGIAVTRVGAVFARAVSGVGLPLIMLEALLFFAAAWIVREQRPPFLSVDGPGERPHGA